MAKRRRSKKGRRSTKRRRLFSRRRRRYRRGTTKLMRGPVNKRALAKFTYTDYVTLNGGSSETDHIMVANGMYDPDNTLLLNHQPKGFDQLMEQYNEYTVLGAKITVLPMVPRANTYTGRLAIVLSGNVSQPFSGQGFGGLVESSMKKTFYHLHPNATDRLKALTLKYSTKRFFSVKSSIGMGAYKGNAGANPSEKAYFHILWAGPYGDNPGDIKCMVKIQYIVMFTEPKPIDQS